MRFLFRAKCGEIVLKYLFRAKRGENIFEVPLSREARINFFEVSFFARSAENVFQEISKFRRPTHLCKTAPFLTTVFTFSASGEFFEKCRRQNLGPQPSRRLEQRWLYFFLFYRRRATRGEKFFEINFSREARRNFFWDNFFARSAENFFMSLFRAKRGENIFELHFSREARRKLFWEP